MDLPAVIAHSPVFRGCSLEEIGRVAGLARVRRFSDGEVLVREDDAASELFLIAEGRAEVRIRWPHAQGDEAQQIGFLRKGDVVGEIALVDLCTRSATVQAVGPLLAVVLPNDRLRRLFEEDPLLGYRVMGNLARLLAGRIRETNLKLRNTIANLLY